VTRCKSSTHVHVYRAWLPQGQPIPQASPLASSSARSLAVSGVGFAKASLWFYVGVAFFAAIVAFIPEPDSSNLVIEEDEIDKPCR
jgi:hypothetical protein